MKVLMGSLISALAYVLVYMLLTEFKAEMNPDPIVVSDTTKILVYDVTIYDVEFDTSYTLYRIEEIK